MVSDVEDVKERPECAIFPEMTQVQSYMIDHGVIIDKSVFEKSVKSHL